VVGDIHGQLSDLIHILDHVGPLSSSNRLVFNGDFVDRGQESVEVITLIFAQLAAYGPDVIYLNRGNHEDLAVNRVYGFESEVRYKYDSLMFDMFEEVFNHIPLFTIINRSIFVVHAGLFHTAEVTLDDLQEIDRSQFSLRSDLPSPAKSPADARREFLFQLQRDCMWSDPTEKMGVHDSPRGAGVLFGPDITKRFLELNGLDMIVRSHECVYTGFDLPYQSSSNHHNNIDQFYRHTSISNNNTSSSSHHHHHNHHNNNNNTTNNYQVNNNSNVPTNLPPPPMNLLRPPRSDSKPLLCTLFSASNYCGGDNQAAILTFYPVSSSSSSSSSTLKSIHQTPLQPVGGSSQLQYSIYYYKTSDAEPGTTDKYNITTLRELIYRRKKELLAEFLVIDAGNEGFISRIDWATTMQKVTLISIRWLMIINTVIPSTALTPSSVHYHEFLNSYKLVSSSDDEKFDDMKIIDDLYGQRKKLESLFCFFDTDGNGIISLSEFRMGCKILNDNLPADSQLVNIDETLKLMDFDGSGSIDINEFFEVRLID